MDEIGLRHLIRVIGLCQTPRDLWSDEDSTALRKAQKYVQQNREDPSESKREETSTGVVGQGSRDEDYSSTEG